MKLRYFVPIWMATNIVNKRDIESATRKMASERAREREKLRRRGGKKTSEPWIRLVLWSLAYKNVAFVPIFPITYRPAVPNLKHVWLIINEHYRTYTHKASIIALSMLLRSDINTIFAQPHKFRESKHIQKWWNSNWTRSFIHRSNNFSNMCWLVVVAAVFTLHAVQ